MGLVAFRKYWFLLVLAAMGLTSCVDEERFLNDSSAKLSFSQDTVMFDTVFATMGTTTQQVRVYNDYDEAMLINSVMLKSGQSSRFRINVDGDTSFVARDIEIGAHDSIFIFVQANINPNDQLNPYVVEDAIVFSFNNRQQELPVMAFGRNAVYHLPDHRAYSIYTNSHGVQDTDWYPYSIIDCANWDHTRPHVIFGFAVVNSNETLRLLPGETLYFSNDGYLWVYDSATLDVHGAKGNPVRFTSMRHDGWYDSLPGQWGYIWLSSGSKNNNIEWALIENGLAGIVADTNVNSNPTLTINNTVIQNHSLSGIVGRGTYIVGDNLLVDNCGQTVLSLQYGGRYRFTSSTFANYWRYDSRKVPAVILNNYYQYNETTIYPRHLQQADFYNCILYGNYTGSDNTGELLLDYLPVAQFNCTIRNCLIRSNIIDEDGNCLLANAPNLSCSNLKVNKDPLFVEPKLGDFHLGEESPAIGAGDAGLLVSGSDLEGVARANPPAIGALEYVAATDEKAARATMPSYKSQNTCRRILPPIKVKLK